MPSILDHKDEIQRLGWCVRSQRIKKKNFDPRYDRWFEDVFPKEDEYDVTREDILNEYQTGNKILAMKKALCWGFPTGNRGYTEYWANNLLPHLPEIVEKFSEINGRTGSWRDFIKIVKKKGVGNGTYTKLLYFSGAKVINPDSQCRTRAMILDSVILDEIRFGGWEEFSADHCPQTSRFTAKLYEKYCEILDCISGKVKRDPEQVEYWLFLRSKKRKSKSKC